MIWIRAKSSRMRGGQPGCRTYPAIAQVTRRKPTPLGHLPNATGDDLQQANPSVECVELDTCPRLVRP
jgi:hypothetical protein